MLIRTPEVLGPFPPRAKRLPRTENIDGPIPEWIVNWPYQQLGQQAVDIFDPKIREDVKLGQAKRSNR